MGPLCQKVSGNGRKVPCCIRYPLAFVLLYTRRTLDLALWGTLTLRPTSSFVAIRGGFPRKPQYVAFLHGVAHGEFSTR